MLSTRRSRRLPNTRRLHPPLFEDPLKPKFGAQAQFSFIASFTGVTGHSPVTPLKQARCWLPARLPAGTRGDRAGSSRCSAWAEGTLRRALPPRQEAATRISGEGKGRAGQGQEGRRRPRGASPSRASLSGYTAAEAPAPPALSRAPEEGCRQRPTVGERATPPVAACQAAPAPAPAPAVGRAGRGRGPPPLVLTACRGRGRAGPASPRAWRACSPPSPRRCGRRR